MQWKIGIQESRLTEAKKLAEQREKNLNGT